jgi:hypothetical protein
LLEVKWLRGSLNDHNISTLVESGGGVVGTDDFIRIVGLISKTNHCMFSTHVGDGGLNGKVGLSNHVSSVVVRDWRTQWNEIGLSEVFVLIERDGSIEKTRIGSSPMIQVLLKIDLINRTSEEELAYQKMRKGF